MNDTFSGQCHQILTSTLSIKCDTFAECTSLKISFIIKFHLITTETSTFNVVKLIENSI